MGGRSRRRTAAPLLRQCDTSAGGQDQLASIQATRHAHSEALFSPRREGEEMKDIRLSIGRELKWTQPSGMRREFELRDGDELVATLRFRSAFG